MFNRTISSPLLYCFFFIFLTSCSSTTEKKTHRFSDADHVLSVKTPEHYLSVTFPVLYFERKKRLEQKQRQLLLFLTRSDNDASCSFEQLYFMPTDKLYHSDRMQLAQLTAETYAVNKDNANIHPFAKPKRPFLFHMDFQYEHNLLHNKEVMLGLYEASAVSYEHLRRYPDGYLEKGSESTVYMIELPKIDQVKYLMRIRCSYTTGDGREPTLRAEIKQILESTSIYGVIEPDLMTI